MDWNLTSLAMGGLLFLAGYRIGHSRGRGASGRERAWHPDPDISDEDIRAELRAGRKIEAIKLYRQRSGTGLKQAKEAVEAMDAAMGRVRTRR